MLFTLLLIQVSHLPGNKHAELAAITPTSADILHACCYKRSVMALTRDLVPPVPPMSGVFMEAGTVASVSRMADSSLHHRHPSSA